MHLRAVAAAARIGVSLEPFTGEMLNVLIDTDGVLHFDRDCHRAGDSNALTLPLEEMHLHRSCTVCIRPYHFPERVERYGQAVELLQRAKFLAHEIEPLEGLARARNCQQVASCTRNALRLVYGLKDSSVADIERFASALCRSISIDKRSTSIDEYLDWAASLSVDPRDLFVHLRTTEPLRWRGRVEHARGALRIGGWAAFVDAIGDVGTDVEEYRRVIDAVRRDATYVLVEVPAGDSEGDLLCWLAKGATVERHGTCFAAVPEWVIETADVLGATLQVIGAVAADDVELVELYADLSRTREGASALEAARRLRRGRNRA